MNSKRHPISRLISMAAFPLNALALAGFLFVVESGSFAAATTLQLGFDEPGSVNEFTRAAFLTWNAETGGVYKVQSRASLDPATPWVTEEPVLATTPTVQWSSPDLLVSTKYYRLVLPQPEIFSVEPNVVDSNGTNTDIYILGQRLPTNALVEVGGKFFTPEVIDADGVWARVSLNGLPPGCPFPCFSINVVEAGTSNVIATLPNALQVTPGASQQLLEPPVPPPGTPALMKAKEKANRTRSVGARGGGPGSFDGGNDVAGKKGLNAVNVKLARMAGGGGDEDGDSDDGRGRLQFQPEGTKGVRVGGHRKPDELVFNVINPRASRQFGDSDVLLHSGEVQVQTVDLVVSGRGLDFIWARTYRSRTGTNTVMGNRWSHSYDISVEQDAAGIAVNDGTGRRDIYFRGTNGIYSRDEFFNEGVLSNKIFTLIFPDTGKWEFNPFDGSAASGKLARLVDRNGNAITLDYDAKGQCDRIIDTLGRTNTISYGPDGLINAVKDFAGRAVTYTYHVAGGAGGSVGDLASVTTTPVFGTPNGNDFPDGKTTSYTYSQGYPDDRENHLLLTIVDPKGQTSETHVYQHNQTDLEFLRCVGVQSGTNTPARFSWKPHSVKPGDYATIQCFVNDPVGNVTECFFDSRNRCVLERELTGRAVPGLAVTDTVNRPTGKLRADDPDSYETRWTWNNDSLCTLVVHAHGTGGSMIYERDFDRNASPRKKGDLRILRELACCGGADTDGDGVPDTTELTTTFQYDPRFGSPARKGWDGTIKGRFGRPAINTALNRDGLFNGNIGINEMLPDTSLRYKGWDGTIKGNGLADAFARGPRQTVSLDGTYDPKNRFGRPAINTALNHPDRFVISSTDPRGTVTEAGYDAQGNRVKVKFPWLPGAEADFAYNAFGQCTAITNAVDASGYRRVDTCSYYTNGAQAGYLQQSVVDATGLALASSYEYDERGNVVRRVDPRGNDWLFTYNALDQCLQAQSPGYGGAAGGRIIQTRYCDRNDNVVRYDIQNRDGDGVLDPVNPLWTTLYEYDGLDRCAEIATEISETIAGAISVTNRFFYDGNDQLVAVHSPEAVAGNDPFAIVAFQYDERGLLMRTTRAPGSVLNSSDEFDYDGGGNLRVVRNGVATGAGAAAGAATRCAYDGFDRLVGIADPMGNIATFAYDRNANLVYQRFDGETNDVAGSVGNRRLSEARYQYDALNRLTRFRPSFFDVFTEIAISDGEATSSFTYAPNGDRLSMTDDNSHTTRFDYDTVGRLSAVTDPQTNVVAYAYDAAGNILSVTQTERSDLTPALQQFVTTYAYDSLHRLVECADNVGNTNRYTYNACDDLVGRVDPGGNVCGWIYDGLGRTVFAAADLDGDGAFTSAADVVTAQTWDGNSRLVGGTDGNTNTTRYAYDALDRCVAVTNADGTNQKLIWSPRSNLVGEENANGTIITNTYDLLDRCVSRAITPGPTVAATTTFETFAFDGLSRLVQADNDVSQLDYGYDSLGNCVRRVQDGLGTAVAFDGAGNCLSLTYPSGRVVTYTYNPLDRVVNVATTSGGVAHPQLAAFSYDGDRVSRIARDNGVNTRIGWNGLANPANTAGDYGWRQVSGVNHQVANGGAVVDRRALAYDRSQNKILRAQLTPFTAGQRTSTNAWAYDALDRLVRSTLFRANSIASKGYQLDGNGNRQRVVSDGVIEPYSMDPTTPDPADFQVDQYTVTPFGAQTYDGNGNLRSRNSPDVQLQYDYADRLVAVNDLSTGSLVPIVSFTYDALGRRLSKTTDPVTPVQTQYIHGGGDDCDDILEERQGGVVTRAYCWGQNGVARTAERCKESDLSNQLIAVFTGSGAAQYYHGDDLGNVLALTDAGGKVIERFDYDDYGVPQFLTSDGVPIQNADASITGNPFLFRCMEWDGETGLYYRHKVSMSNAQSNPMYRESGMSGVNPMYEDPKTGRGISRSPGGFTGGGNGFAFAGDNPWSQDRVVRKMIPVTQPDITGAQRRAAVANGSAGLFLSRGTRSMLLGSEDDPASPRSYKAKQGKTGKAAK